MRKTALVAGIFYLITFISIPTLALYGPVKNHRDWILGFTGLTSGSTNNQNQSSPAGPGGRATGTVL
jgi:hypothetical protein